MSQDWFAVSTDGPVNIITFTVPEHVDTADFDRMHEALLSTIDAKPSGQWILDLSGLSYMGSSALGLMVNLRQRIRQADGRLALCCMSAKLQQVFRTCSLERLFVIRNERAEALKTVGRSGWSR